MEDVSYVKKIKTPDGTVITYYFETGKAPKLHCLTGPAVKYPRGSKKKDVYAIYGREMSKKEWMLFKSDTKITKPLPEYV